MKLVTIGDYDIAINEQSTDEQIIRPVLTGSEYTKFVKPAKSDIWLDAGAHVGAFALRFAPLVAHIYSYEPEPTNFTLLEFNTRKYNLRNVSLHNSALIGDDAKEVILSMSNGKDHSSGSILPYVRRKEYFPVPAANILQVIETYSINCVKMDIEGAEYECVKALPMRTMKKLKCLVMEYHFSMLGDVGTGEFYFELIKHLKRGFRNVQYKTDVGKNWNCIVYASNEEKHGKSD